MSLYIYLTKTCTCGETKTKLAELNVTHSLSTMAKQLGVYDWIWYPEDHVLVKTASDLIKSLGVKLKILKDNREYFEHYEYYGSGSNDSWGTYDDFVKFLSDYLEVCKKHPDAKIEVRR